MNEPKYFQNPNSPFLLNIVQEGDLVIDPCAGSFVSLRACQKLGRDFLGTDLTLKKLMKFNINKERSRELLKKEGVKISND